VTRGPLTISTPRGDEWARLAALTDGIGV